MKPAKKMIKQFNHFNSAYDEQDKYFASKQIKLGFFGGCEAHGNLSNDSTRVSIAILPQVQSRGVFLIWIIWIMKVLTASLLPSPLGNGDISVSITSMNGEEICRVELVELPGGTLADLEKILCDPDGPMFGSYPASCFLFYAENEPTRPLDRKLQMDAFHSLVIKRG